MDLGSLVIFFLALGTMSGFAAGLLGVGGGIILVPGLYFGLQALGYESEFLMHVAIGTSLAIIVPTGISSALSHARKKYVQYDVLKHMAVGVVIGALAGSFIADQIPGIILKYTFGVLIFILACVMIFNPAERKGWCLKASKLRDNMAGFIIGLLSSLIGIGGATLSVPYASLSGTAIHKAVGTAAALGLFISVPASMGFLFFGQDKIAALPFTTGYINVLAWAMIVPASVLMAPVGAHVAHKLPVKKLRFIFSALMIIVAFNMLLGG